MDAAVGPKRPAPERPCDGMRRPLRSGGSTRLVRNVAKILTGNCAYGYCFRNRPDMAGVG